MQNNSKIINTHFDPSNIIFPINSIQIFGNKKPTALEIGFGEGEFIINLSLSNSDRNYIGIEKKRGRFKKAVKLADKLYISNLKLLNMEAEIALSQIFNKNLFDIVYINFPDPWPKNKHLKHRLFNPLFIKNLSKVIIRNGVLIIKTDHKDFMLNIINALSESLLFKNNFSLNGFEKNKDGEFETKFEKEFKEIGKEIYFTTFTNLSD